MYTPETLAIIFAVFVLAGLVKGVVGLGLPTVALALLTALVGLKEAMVLMLIPSFVTNFWQGVVGGAFAFILRRLWPLLAAVCIGTWAVAGILARADAVVLAGLLGVLLCLYSGVSLVTPQVPPPGRHERWLSPAAGAVTGIFTGLTGSFVFPAVLYLQALALPRDVLVQSMGICFTVATAALAVALQGQNLLPAELGAISGVALVPAVIGMVLGQRIRQRLSEQRFRQVLFCMLMVLGLYIAVRAFAL